MIIQQEDRPVLTFQQEARRAIAEYEWRQTPAGKLRTEYEAVLTNRLTPEDRVITNWLLEQLPKGR